MYTVIILNKRASEEIKNLKFLFKPFVDEGIIGFCNWNDSGTDVKSSVPDLYALIKGKKEWRAIILNLDSIYGYKDAPEPSKQNPFDYTDVDSNTLPHESEIPLIKLTHIIGGYNVAPIREFEKGFEYYDENSACKKRVKASDLSTEELQELSLNFDDINPVYIEKSTPKDIEELQQTLTDKYLFSDVRPIEIDLIAMRQNTVKDEKSVIIESWKNHLEMTSSAFWEQNHYPNSCRFLLYDITNSDNSLYQKQIIEFWLSVLTFSINKVAASTLQAYRLYKIGVNISNENLAQILNGHLNKMNSAYAFVKEQMQLRPEYSFDEDDRIVEKQQIPVSVETKGGNDLYINVNEIGLSRDCPQDEAGFWNSEVKHKKKNLETFLKTPRRSIDKSAAFLKRKSESFKGERYQLDRFQVDDLKEIMSDLENEIVSAQTSGMIDRKKTEDLIAVRNKDVKKEIACRMRKTTVVISGIIALLLTFIGYLPYLISSGKVNTKYIGTALLLILGVLIVTSVGGLISLLIQRGKLISCMKEFNNIMRGVINSVSSYAEHFEDYFSNICTFMKAQSILDGIQIKKLSEYSTSSILNSHKNSLNSAIARDNEWMSSYDLKREDEIIVNVTSYFNVNVVPRNNSLYYFPQNHEEKDIPINSTGDMVTSPYKFVERLKIEREDIYDEEDGK